MQSASGVPGWRPRRLSENDGIDSGRASAGWRQKATVIVKACGEKKKEKQRRTKRLKQSGGRRGAAKTGKQKKGETKGEKSAGESYSRKREGKEGKRFGEAMKQKNAANAEDVAAKA